jgi:hypothetical protein
MHRVSRAEFDGDATACTILSAVIDAVEIAVEYIPS